jgi:hypothetical protein
MNPEEWQSYRELLMKIYEELGGITNTANLLGRHRDYLYKWVSSSNYNEKTGKMRRKMTLLEAQKINEKLEWVSMKMLRPDLGKYFE